MIRFSGCKQQGATVGNDEATHTLEDEFKDGTAPVSLTQGGRQPWGGPLLRLAPPVS